ncbi:MAG: GNAT family N-acetyltransferase [Clostridiaceae bacterium]
MKILHDKGNSIFYMRDAMGLNIAEMKYEIKDEIMIINETYVHEDLRGKDIGKNLIELGISFARKEGYLIEPKCEFAKKILRQYYPDMLATPAFT